MLLSFSKGESIAIITASLARDSPLAVPKPIKATPLFCITVFTSLKSI